MANVEAWNIVNQKPYMLDGTYSNDFMVPPVINTVSAKTKLSDLLYKKYKILVFDLVYTRVKYGKFYILKQISIKSLGTTILFYIMGISRILLKTLRILFAFVRGQTTNEILFDIFIYEDYNRKLVRINNVWVANGPRLSLNNLFKNAVDVCGNPIVFSERETKIFKEIVERVHVSTSTNFTYAQFIEKSVTKLPHKIYHEVLKNTQYVGLETGFDRANLNNNYCQVPIINRYDGEKKPSTLLEKPIDGFTQVSDEIKTSIKRQALGAVLYGYNTSALSHKYNISISTLESAHVDLLALIKSKNWDVDTNVMLKLISDLEVTDVIEITKN